MPKVSVIIPAYNVEDTVADVVSGCDKSYEVIVVDDGSTDKTYERATSTRAQVIRHQKNMGKGQAMLTGASHAKGSIIVFIDADMQHLPEDIPKLVLPIQKGHCDMAIGSRLLGSRSKMPMLRRVSNSISTRLIQLRTRHKILDTQSGFRAIRKEAIEKMPLKSKRFAIETEMLICAAKLNVRIVEVPIHIIYKNGAFHFSFLDIIKFLKMIFFKRC
ncbi:MAG: glycosyltransferase family 2 protein [Candidatus Methanofastidiosia archaeon]